MPGIWRQATCALLGSAVNSPANAQEEPGWDFNSSLLYYGESDGRVMDGSLRLLARRLFEDDKSLTMTLTVDTLTGATPRGATPIPLAQMLDVGGKSNKLGAQDKTLVDVLLGVTQVVNRNLLLQLNYSYGNSRGYLNDGYRIISMVDGITGDTVARVPTPGVEGPSHVYRFESRPRDRSRHSFYGQGKYFWGGRVLDLSYRYMTDDWEIDSHTLDAKLRFPFGDNRYLEPHLRCYTQSAADFYRASLVDSDPLPE